MSNDTATGLAYTLDGSNNATITGVGAYDVAGNSGILTIPATVDGYNVTRIGSSSFQSVTSINNVTIPGFIKSVGDWAFSYNRSITNITLQEGVESLGYQAFAATNITQITIPSSVTNIGGMCFYATLIANVTIPSTVTQIGDGAFHAENILTSATFVGGYQSGYHVNLFGGSPNNMTITTSDLSTWPEPAYFYFNNKILRQAGGAPPPSMLAYTVSGNDVTITGIGTYDIAANNGALIIPATVNSKSVITIQRYAFTSKTSVVSVTIPNSVVNIGDGAFSNMSALTSISIPGSVRTMGSQTFYGCYLLASMTLGEGIPYLPDMFIGSTRITQITIPSSVTQLAYYCMYQADHLTSISIPDTVLTIGTGAFASTNNLTSVILGSYRSGYDVNAFTGANNITSFTTSNLASWPSATYFASRTLTSAGGGGGGGGGGGAVACFAEGTRVLTQHGYKAIEDLSTRDYIVTPDRRVIDFNLLKTTLATTTKSTAPYLIQPHAFGRNMPSAPIRLSPSHKIQLRKGLWTSAEKAALTNPLVKQCEIGAPVTYYHIQCENYLKDDVIAEGMIAESFCSMKASCGRRDIYSWNKRLNAYTRIGHMDNAKLSNSE